MMPKTIRALLAEREADAIARKIGKAQRRVVLALSDDWGPSGDHAAAKRLWYRTDIPILLDHRHRTNDCWQLRPIGLAVQAALRSEKSMTPTIEAMAERSEDDPVARALREDAGDVCQIS